MTSSRLNQSKSDADSKFGIDISKLKSKDSSLEPKESDRKEPSKIQESEKPSIQKSSDRGKDSARSRGNRGGGPIDPVTMMRIENMETQISDLGDIRTRIDSLENITKYLKVLTKPY